MACSCPRGAGRRHGLLRGGLVAAGLLVATFCAGAPARAQMNEGTADPTAPSLWLVHAIQETKDFNGFICPAEVRLDGSIFGDAGMTGTVIFTSKQEGPVVEPQSQVQEQQFSLDTYGTFDIVKSFQMQWRNVPAAGDIPPRQKVTLQFIVARHHTVIAETQRTIELACRKPTPPELTLSFRITKEEIIKGFVCPTEILTDGHIVTKEALSGQVQHQVWFGPKTPSASATKDINMGAGDALSYGFFAPIDWRGYVFSHDLTPQRSLSLHFRVYREGAFLAETARSVLVSCRNALGGGGQLSAGTETSETRPGGAAIGRLAKQQAQAFAIQAPQGLVRRGEIRLSGGAANDKYALKFLRRNGGGYVAVNAAQLPKQMTGLVASFPLQALSGGRDWRLEVCPLGGAPTACKTSDVRLTRIGGAGAAAAPSPQSPDQPQGTIFILPGVTN